MNETYVVHSARALLGPVVPLLFFAVFAYFWLRIGDGDASFLILFGLVWVGIVLWQASRAWTRLRVDARGVSLTYPTTQYRRGSSVPVRRAPWTSVRRVELDQARSVVRVVLRHDAPMPDWLTARIIAPNDPESGISYEREVPGLDVQACAAAVRAVSSSTEVRFV